MTCLAVVTTAAMVPMVRMIFLMVFGLLFREMV